MVPLFLWHITRFHNETSPTARFFFFFARIYQLRTQHRLHLTLELKPENDRSLIDQTVSRIETTQMASFQTHGPNLSGWQKTASKKWNLTPMGNSAIEWTPRDGYLLQMKKSNLQIHNTTHLLVRLRAVPGWPLTSESQVLGDNITSLYNIVSSAGSPSCAHCHTHTHIHTHGRRQYECGKNFNFMQMNTANTLGTTGLARSAHHRARTECVTTTRHDRLMWWLVCQKCGFIFDLLVSSSDHRGRGADGERSQGGRWDTWLASQKCGSWTAILAFWFPFVAGTVHTLRCVMWYV